jgi:hypothetical protein
VTAIPDDHILCRWFTLRPSRLPQLHDRLCSAAIDDATVHAAVRAVQHATTDAAARCLLCHAEPINTALLGVLVAGDTAAAYPFCATCCDRHGTASSLTDEVLTRLRSAGVAIAVLPPAVAAVGHA